MPFEGVKAPTNEKQLSEIVWDSIASSADWSAVDINEINLKVFPWEIATDPAKTSDEQLARLISRVELDTTKPVAKPEFRFDFNGHQVMPKNNIMCLTGIQKSGKSQLLNILCSIVLNKSRRRTFGNSDTCGCIGCISPADSVLWIDTEQGTYDVQTNNDRLFNLMGINVDPLMGMPRPDSKQYGLHILPLRPYTPEQRMNISNACIRAYQPDIVIIDGIRDLAHDINSQEEATALSTWCMQVAESRDLWLVLHQNPTGDSTKMRGAIGTELANKASITFEVRKQEGLFSVSVPANGCRQDAGDKPIFFMYGAGGQLYPVNVCDVLFRCFSVTSNNTMSEKDLKKRLKAVVGATETEAVRDFIQYGLTTGCLETVEKKQDDDDTDGKPDKKKQTWYHFLGYQE